MTLITILNRTKFCIWNIPFLFIFSLASLQTERYFGDHLDGTTSNFGKYLWWYRKVFASLAMLTSQFILDDYISQLCQIAVITFNVANQRKVYIFNKDLKSFQLSFQVYLAFGPKLRACELWAVCNCVSD